MTYCTQQDMLDRFGETEILQLTDRDNTGAIDADVLAAAIEDASAAMDGYLGGRYQVPLANPPRALVTLACNIARFFLYDDAAPEAVVQRKQDALHFLEQVAAGKVQLGVAADGGSASHADGAEMTSGGRVFGRDDNGFI